MPLFTKRLRPADMLPQRPAMRTQPLSSGVFALADWLEPEPDPEELVDTYVDEPPTCCSPPPRRTQPSLMTLLDPHEIGNDVAPISTPVPIEPAPEAFSLIVVEDGLDEPTYAAPAPITPAGARRARVGRVVAYAALACVSLLGITELAVFAGG